MSKTIEQLEQEAKQARDDMREVMIDEFGIGATLSDRILSLMIKAVQSNIAHNDAKQEVSGDGSGEALPEVRQEERDSDGWIDWGGGNQPTDDDTFVEVKLRNGEKDFGKALTFYWKNDDEPSDIIAYRIVK